ncbi:GDSL-type esterase/lipase family protein [uncultured Chryseobacterium sp.]|uniref:SGNH/GDSL hydrolase family protein n=1 Tax=uncultured Chryseobacterium sp. TaxID=259322 RepID=UPI00345716E8
MGIGGETTEGLVKRISYETEARNSEEGNIVFIGYGANDLAIKNGMQAVEPERFKANITAAVQKAKQYAEGIYLISILPVARKIDGVKVSSGKLRSSAEILKYNQLLKEVADENTLQYLDFYSGFADDKEILLSRDGVHPNEKGYGIIAEMAIPVIEKYL